MSKSTLSREELLRYFNDPQYRRKNSKGFIQRHKKFFIWFSSALLILFIFLIVYIFSGLPSFKELENPKPALASNVFSYDGKILGQFFIENRIETNIDSLPPHLINALIATEDRKFYSHWGVDLDRIVKATFKNLIPFFGKGGGASTITQQLARNLYKLIEREENFLDVAVRKIREWITAIQLEKTYTKREILEMYFNITWFGRGSYGIESAARNFFGKPASQLNLQESALLIAMLRNPSFYDPIRRPENSYGRRNLILKIMYETNYITKEQYEKAKNDNIRLVRLSEFSKTIAPHFLEFIRQQMIERFENNNLDLYRDGLNIYTTIDYNLQKYANEAVAEHLAEYQKLFDQNWKWNNKDELINSLLDKAIRNHSSYLLAEDENAKKIVYNELKNNQKFIDSVKKVAQTIEVGFVAIDPKTGHIRAMVGGVNPKNMYGLNHVTQIRRQPGSAFKPIIYTVAVDNGYPLCTEILNEQITIQSGGQSWTPKNSDGNYGGYLNLRRALAGSVNIVSARLIYQGLSPLNEIPVYAKRLGIKSPIQPFYSVALGTSEVTPIELTSAFATFANNGVNIEPNGIVRIEDRNGLLIKDFQPEMRDAISPQTAYLMTELMSSVIDEGTAQGVRKYFHLPAAGKTGTTQDFADAWFVGYTPQLCAGVWVGFDDQRVKFTGWYGQGARAAAPIWAKFMAKAYADPTTGLTLEYFEQPDGITTATFCKTSLQQGIPKLASDYCPAKVTDIVNSKYIPEICDIHTVDRGYVPIQIDTVGNRIDW